jgi:hypothetical protein
MNLDQGRLQARALRREKASNTPATDAATFIRRPPDRDSSHTYRGPNGDLIVTWGPAPPLPDQVRPDFDALDRNGDNHLSLAEVESHRLLHSDFIYADRNRDGSISRTELARWN